jgi:hypothetical protein
MHVQIRSYTVTRAMSIVQAKRPEILPRQRVESKSGRSFRELAALKSDVTFQHKRVRFFLFGARLAKVQSARRICRTVQILRARVAEVDGLGIDGRAGTFHGLVVNDGGVGTGGGDGVEGEADEEIVFARLGSEKFMTEPA